jgi:sialidase-1
MGRFKLSSSTLISAFLLATVVAQAEDPPRTDVFVAGTDGYHTFRIPALVVSARGTLLAFSEGRKNARSDTGDIDVVLRRSTDNGRTWGALQVVWDDGPNTAGNPCPVVDRNTGTIWLPVTRNLGGDKQSEIVAGTSRGTRDVWMTKSTDDGATWSKPIEITAQVKDPGWTWFATGPGVGIQMKSGRMVIPCDHSPAGKNTERGHVIFSDDGGTTWKLGGKTAEGCGEAQVVELTDGSLLMNMRHVGGGRHRRVTISQDGGLTWGETRDEAALPEPGCQASIVRYAPVAGTNGRLLFVNPAGDKRERLTLRFSVDDGKTWSVGRVVHAGPAAYSCLAVLPDGMIGVLFECGTRNAYERIAFAAAPWTWVADER